MRPLPTQAAAARATAAPGRVRHVRQGLTTAGSKRAQQTGAAALQAHSCNQRVQPSTARRTSMKALVPERAMVPRLFTRSACMDRQGDAHREG